LTKKGKQKGAAAPRVDAAALMNQKELIRAEKEKQMRSLAKELGFTVTKKPMPPNQGELFKR